MRDLNNQDGCVWGEGTVCGGELEFGAAAGLEMEMEIMITKRSSCNFNSSESYRMGLAQSGRRRRSDVLAKSREQRIWQTSRAAPYIGMYS